MPTSAERLGCSIMNWRLVKNFLAKLSNSVDSTCLHATLKQPNSGVVKCLEILMMSSGGRFRSADLEAMALYCLEVGAREMKLCEKQLNRMMESNRREVPS